ncbi:AraC family transcriptional regulator, partial [Pseudoxanthomonas sp. SGD-10]
IQGECFFSSKEGTTLLSLQSSEFNIYALPKDKSEVIFTTSKSDVFAIYLDKDFFFKHISQEHAFYRLKNVVSFALAAKENLYINPKIKNVLNEIITCAFEGHLRDLYTKAKVIELIALVLMQFEEEKAALLTLKQRDIDKMNLAKELIDNNPYDSYTITYLARTVGTNEQYLKKHFKMLFGQSVYQYILSRKMEKAREMILSGDYRIADIAEISGYKHATHFTNAFKKFFGYVPLTLKSK